MCESQFLTMHCYYYFLEDWKIELLYFITCLRYFKREKSTQRLFNLFLQAPIGYYNMKLANSLNKNIFLPIFCYYFCIM